MRNVEPTPPYARTTFIVVGALAFAPVVYSILMFLLLAARPEGFAKLELPVPVWAIMAAVSFASFGSGFVVLSTPAFRPDPGAAPRDYWAKVQARAIVGGALREVVGVYGLVGFFLGLSLPLALVFQGVAILLTLALFPGLFAELETLKRKIREAGGESAAPGPGGGR